MKKVFLLFTLLTLPVYATDIPYENNSYNPSTGTGMCDSDVLQHDSGTIRLRAKYEPNQMNIRWYNVNTELVPTNVSANTCEYDDVLTLPEIAPQRTGYTFTGWRVRPLTDFALLNLPNGLERWGKGQFCRHAIGDESSEIVACNSDSHFIEMNNDEWQTLFNNNGQTLYGMAYCSKKPGNNNSITFPVSTRSQWQTSSLNELDTYSGNDAASNARYCWCKATGYKSSSSSPVQGSASPLGWIFYGDRGSESSCVRNCAYNCANHAQLYPRFRSVLFLPVEN